MPKIYVYVFTHTVFYSQLFSCLEMDKIMHMKTIRGLQGTSVYYKLLSFVKELHKKSCISLLFSCMWSRTWTACSTLPTVGESRRGSRSRACLYPNAFCHRACETIGVTSAGHNFYYHEGQASHWSQTSTSIYSQTQSCGKAGVVVYFLL